MGEPTDNPAPSAGEEEESAALAAKRADEAMRQADLLGRDDLAIVVCLTGPSDDEAIFLPALEYCQIPSCIVREASELAPRLDAEAGVLLIGDEALNDDVAARLGEWFAAQPFWSALPLIVVTGGDETTRSQLVCLLKTIGATHTTFLPRPMRAETLLAAVHVAIRSRALQYRLRDRLALHDVPDAGLVEAQAEELRTIYQTAPIGLALLDRELRYVRVNQHMADFNGRPTKDHLGQRLSTVLPDLAPEMEEALKRVLETGEPILEHESTGETPARPGEQRTWLSDWYPLRGERGETIGINAIAQDVTAENRERQALERAHALEHQLNTELETLVARRTAMLEQQAAELKRLALALSRAEHEERKRLSETLHGGLQQNLLAMRIQLQDWAERHGAEPPVTVMTLLEEALSLSRSLSYELSPPLRPDATLTDELQWICNWSREHHGLTVDLEVGPIRTEPSETPRLFLMQSLRELLVNVVKHARVREARVEVEERDGQLVVRVGDRGKGFDSAVLDEGGTAGFGLPTIRGRTVALGGEFNVASRSGGGMQVTIRIPVDGVD